MRITQKQLDTIYNYSLTEKQKEFISGLLKAQRAYPKLTKNQYDAFIRLYKFIVHGQRRNT